ncbi:glycosyltransferase family 4 protein [Leifsonia poae]|uniref:Glycosyl transferase n=1 Tax=Leifsonia poae TaxID=110933 RepID=A0A9W6H7Q1_9MICO|nr:glycosyltransferase family 1 protein [Leifsonia poae]GLJ74964.1 glycosyl transferase [Leifsonia poae]
MSRRQRVLIDATAMPANHGGVARYIYGVLEGFPPESIDLFVACQPDDAPTVAAVVPWAHILKTSPALRARPLRMLWEQFVLPLRAVRHRIDVIHSPHYSYPLLWARRRVVTLHDATFFSHPLVHTSLKRLYFRGWIRRAWRSADAIVTPSAATASELSRYLGAPHGVVSVAHLGVNSSRFHPPTPDQLDDFRADHGLDDTHDWFAFLGTIEPRKNVGSLLDAYAAIRSELGESAPRLLIAGARGWDVEAISRLDAMGANSGVSSLGYVPVDHLAALLGGAVAVVYPSFGEGFGLPVVEAMSCGATVITTRHLAIPEVGGDAVLYTEPDAASLREAMLNVLDDDAMRTDMSARAIVRATKFDWAATALAHLRAYEKTPSDAAAAVAGFEES